MRNQAIKILIVEDEAIVAMDLAAGLQAEGYEISGIADNAEDAMRLFSDHDIDILLMDIHILGEKDGIDTSMELLSIKQVPIIYLSAYSDMGTISRIKDIHPAAFLTKPYSIANVRIAIEVAISNFAVTSDLSSVPVLPISPSFSLDTDTPKERAPILQMNEFIFIKQNYHFIKISIQDLLYVEADNNYIYIVTNDKKFSVRLSLNQFLEKIKFPSLERIHRSYAINMDCITSFNEQTIMIGQFELPVGRNYKEDFLRHFNFK